MAEEYAEKQNLQNVSPSGIVRCKIADAFLKGLKAGRPQWHKVADGLPEELHDVLCFVIHNEHRYVLQGYLREGRWVLSPLGTYLNNDDVIAWKEIVLPELPKESE